MILCRCNSDNTDVHDDDGYMNESREFWMTIEFKGPDGLRGLANETKCPECGSKDWQTTDLARNK